MDRKNRPVGKEKHVTEGGGNVHRRGEGLGNGSVGEQSNYSDRNGESEGKGIAGSLAEEVLENAIGGKGSSTAANMVEKAVENLVVSEVEHW